MLKIAAVWVTLASAAASAAGQKAFDAAAAAKAVAPFLDEQTVGIARIDVTRLNVQAMFDKVRRIIERVEESDERRQEINRELARAQQDLAGWLAEFTDAGGREVYMVVSMADLPGPPVFAVIPLRPGADADRIVRFLRPGSAGDDRPASTQPRQRRPRGPRRWQIPPEVCERIGGVLFAGSKQTLQRIKAGRPVPRPEVAKAFAAAGDAAGHALILPTADSRKVIDEMMPTLPQELGGEPSTAVTRGVMWAAIAADPPPGISLRLTIQSQDAASAQALRRLIDRAAQMGMKAMREHRFLKELAGPVEKHLPALLPAVKGDRLLLALDESRIDAMILDLLGPLAREARKQAKRAMVASNASGIVRAMYQYNADRGEWPKDLQALVDGKYIPAQLLVNPSLPGREVGYVYLRPPVPMRQIKDLSALIVIHEPYDQWKQDLVVGFADGHVATIREEQHFKEFLAKTKAIKAPGK